MSSARLASKSREQPYKALSQCTHSKSSGNVAGPARQKEDPRQHKDGANGPDRVALFRRQNARRRSQRSYMDGMTRGKRIKPFAGNRYPM
jgi:hypothetical protein